MLISLQQKGQEEGIVHIQTVAKMQSVLASTSPNEVVVVKIGAGWCKPCQKVAPAWHELATGKDNEEAWGGVSFFEVDLTDKKDKEVRTRPSIRPLARCVVLGPFH